MATLLHSALGVGRADRRAGAEKCEGRRFDPPPLNHLRAGGGDGCGEEVRWDGEGRRARPLWFEPPAGATDAGGAPHFDQALPSRSATNFVASPDFTRIRIVRLPSFCASLRALRMSAGLATFFPPAPRMTSPGLTPRA